MRAGLAALAALALTGCRYHVEHVRDGQGAPPRAIARLEPGETSLGEALTALGAPDGVEWTYDADVLVYDHWEVRRSRWEVENPMTFVGRLTPQSLVGEAVTYVVFVASRTGRIAPTPPRPTGAPTPGRPGFTTKPLRLDGDQQGRERVRLVFTRRTQVLERVEVARGRPPGGVGGVARGTFLR
ncbi:MAG: hypothetical protein KF878_19380 [Planctomycetes bacterium]|nr:hypothetical protein [Planctomycetota bacterium]